MSWRDAKAVCVLHAVFFVAFYLEARQRKCAYWCIKELYLCSRSQNSHVVSSEGKNINCQFQFLSVTASFSHILLVTYLYNWQLR